MHSPLAAALAALLTAHAVAVPPGSAVDRVAALVSDPEAQRLAGARGLQFVNVLWEDTGRHQGSSVGPNISDVTIAVANGAGRAPSLMPVLRFPNFADRTADVALDKVWLRTGNQRPGAPEQVVTLRELLAEPGRFLSAPGNGAIRGGTLLAPRDTHALVSAQAAFLPVPRGARATFHPVIFNYQSTAGHPAVLTLLVTRQGTSASIVDNGRDQVGTGAWGQRLFFNDGGQRAPLTAERRSDVEASGVTMNGESSASLGEDANLLMLIQVPLRVERPRRAYALGSGAPSPMMKSEAKAAPMAEAADAMEQAVLGHGELEGPFTELAGLTIERDPRFPVRVTVQFYQATSSGQVTAAEVGKLAALIDAVYTRGDFVGSLVVPAPRDPSRPTAWSGAATPAGSCACAFPGLAERLGVCGSPPRPPIGIR